MTTWDEDSFTGCTDSDIVDSCGKLVEIPLKLAAQEPLNSDSAT